tara:strand:+ start:800 stop:1141 length:342 start_codon:yes stop_codon:yes gene_type:complete
MLRWAYAVIAFLVLSGFTFINNDTLPVLESSIIVISSESLVGLKLTIDNESVIIAQNDLVETPLESGPKALEKVVVDVDLGTHSVIISDPTKPIFRVTVTSRQGITKFLRLRR